MKISTENLDLKIADCEIEIAAAQRLRYRVFVQEMGAKSSAQNHKLGQECDKFDPFFDHLILKDTTKDEHDNVIGVYRLLRGDVARNGIGFYSASEFDLSNLLSSKRRVMELGRSCIDPKHRRGIALHLMWTGLAKYVQDFDIEVLFGAASFSGIDADPFKHALSYLHVNHLAPEDLRVFSQTENSLDMDVLPQGQVDKLTALRQMPPLIKAYLRLGGFVGQGAFVDHNFNTIDVCLLMDTQRMSGKYKAKYEKELTR
jgi:putative hemolysin